MTSSTPTMILGFGLALGAVGVGVWAAKGTRGLHSPGHRGGTNGFGRSRLRGRRTKRSRGLRGPTEVRELSLYCENDGDLHRQQVQPIEKNLAKRLAKGTYDHEKSKKLWGYLADNCAKKYAKEFGDGTPWHKMFSTADRREVAREFADSFKQEHDVQAKYGHTPGGRSR